MYCNHLRKVNCKRKDVSCVLRSNNNKGIQNIVISISMRFIERSTEDTAMPYSEAIQELIAAAVEAEEKPQRCPVHRIGGK